MKKITVIFLIIGILAISVYLLMRNSLNTPGFTPAQAKEPGTETKTENTVLDLRPKLIKKLQQLVKEGSGGLYNLSVHEINPDILNSTLGVSKALLSPDTAAMKQLDLQKKLPDDIFKIKADSIWIDGLGVKDVLSKNVIDVKTIHILHPTIDVYSKAKTYNQVKDPKTLYQRLMNQMKHIGIGKIIIQNAAFVLHDTEKNKKRTFNGVAISLSNIVVDSTTQFDKTRFLFAKKAELSLKNYAIPTSNNLYDFTIGSVSINAVKRLLTAKNLVLQPRYSKQEFQKHITTMQNRYRLSVSSIEFKNINWWSFLNKQNLQSDFAAINKAKFDIYLDRRLPSNPPSSVQDFPNQLLMQLPMKITISKVDWKGLDISYEEFSPQSGKSGTLYINNMNATVSNLTNMPDAIQKNKFTTIKATGVFMHGAPADLSVRFDMSQYKTGTFTASLISQKGFDGTIINPVAEPLGLFMIKRGQLKQLTSDISGNNFTSSANVLFLYNDLHVTPLKKDTNAPEGLTKKSVTSFIANTFILKDQNPSKNGDVRKASSFTNRKPGTTFFNLLWKTTFVGILKTIGAPQRLAK